MVQPAHSIIRQRYTQVVSLGSALGIMPPGRDYDAMAVGS